MKLRKLTVLTVLLAVGFVFAEWHEVAGGTGDAQVRILEQSNTGTTFEVVVPGVEITAKEVDGEEFSVVTLPGGHTAYLEDGKPQVPMVPVLLAIPTGAQVSLQVAAKEIERLRVANIYPLQPSVPISQEPGPFVIDREFYVQEGVYPGEDASVVQTAGVSLAQDLGRDALIQSDGWRPTGVDWLVRDEVRNCRTGHMLMRPGDMLSLPMAFQANSGYAPEENTAPSALKRIGIYSGEFGLAAVGTAIAAAGAVCVGGVVGNQFPDEYRSLVGGVVCDFTYLLTSPFLSGAGTHLGGKLFGERGKFSHALVGGAIGDVLGIVAVYGIWSYTQRHGYVRPTPLLIWLALPPVGSVVAYNIWRSK